MNWASSDVLQQLSDFNKLILLVVLFVEESRAINASQSSALFNFNLENQGTSSNMRPLSVSYRRLDWKYKLLAPKLFSLSASIGKPDARNTFHHLLGILRHVPRKQLYVYSGWYASEEDMSAAEACLFGWMRDNPALSRECVAHSGALIGEIGSTATAACYHYLCLLIATSYLWAFTSKMEDLKLMKKPLHSNLLPHSSRLTSIMTQASETAGFKPDRVYLFMSQVLDCYQTRVVQSVCGRSSYR